MTKEQYQAFRKSDSMQRMREWELLGRPNAAKRELTFLQKYGTPQQQLSAAKLAYDNGWYDRAIFALADAGYWDDVEMRFPMVYNKEIQKHSKAAQWIQLGRWRSPAGKVPSFQRQNRRSVRKV